MGSSSLKVSTLATPSWWDSALLLVFLKKRSSSWAITRDLFKSTAMWNFCRTKLELRTSGTKKLGSFSESSKCLSRGLRKQRQRVWARTGNVLHSGSKLSTQEIQTALTGLIQNIRSHRYNASCFSQINCNKSAGKNYIT